MMAEGHWDSQKASQKETRTRKSRPEVQGDRQEKGQDGEGIEDEGSQGGGRYLFIKAQPAGRLHYQAPAQS